MFLRKCWYVAAWSSEVGETLVGRRLLDEPILLYRLASGEAVAIGDRCPHRFAPLHLGKKVGDAVQCGYHGLIFNAQGQCIANPQSGGRTPPGAGVKRYPLEERHGLLWIWMGDPAEARPEDIPDVGFIVQEGAGSRDGYLHVRADYRLATDNLMDLSHAAFLHAETLGLLTPGLADGELKVSRNGGQVVAAIVMRDLALPGAAGRVDQWLDMTWEPPGVMVLDIGNVAAGSVREGYGRRAIHIVSPETAKTCHYFFRNAGGGRVFVRDPFADEDEPMLAACQEMMGDEEFWDLHPAILPSDAGAVRVRRHLDKLIRDEAAPAA
jgi:nitrite reductase/ring-hydroxylating ferredoxin subunit